MVDDDGWQGWAKSAKDMNKLVLWLEMWYGSGNQHTFKMDEWDMISKEEM